MKLQKPKKDAAALAKMPVMPVPAKGVALSTLAFGDTFRVAADTGETIYEVVNLSAVGSPGLGLVACVGLADGMVHALDGTTVVVADPYQAVPASWPVTPPAVSPGSDTPALK
jgi:hypothetical protein